jgi:hypothetical protein
MDPESNSGADIMYDQILNVDKALGLVERSTKALVNEIAVATKDGKSLGHIP